MLFYTLRVSVAYLDSFCCFGKKDGFLRFLWIKKNSNQQDNIIVFPYILNSDYIEKYQLFWKKVLRKKLYFLYRKGFLTFRNQSKKVNFLLQISWISNKNLSSINVREILRKLRYLNLLCPSIRRPCPLKNSIDICLQRSQSGLPSRSGESLLLIYLLFVLGEAQNELSKVGSAHKKYTIDKKV